VHEEEPPGLQQRVEESGVGRALLSAFIAVTLLTLVAIQLPDSYLRQKVLRVGQPFAQALGLDQNWAVFAPNPRNIVLALEARVTFEDGSTRVWEPPLNDPFVGAYWDYRWRKYIEIVRRDSQAGLWPDLAAYVARRQSGPTRPVRVELIRRWYRLLPPGRPGPLRSRWVSYRFFTMTESDLRARGIT
jgi:hypothetical protein